MTTLHQLLADLELGQFTPVAENGHHIALCPGCRRQLNITESETGVARFECEGGCSREFIVDQLYSATYSALPVIDGASGDQALKLLLARRADVERVKPFRWAWHHRVLLGYLNLFVGDEGVGKGTFQAWFAARLTRGELPGDLHGKPSNVLIVGDEDGFDSVWTPRLVAAGADLARVLHLPELDLSSDTHRLGDLFTAERIKYVGFDQFLDNLGAGVDDWRAKQVREAVAPVRRVAAELDVALGATLHTNKARQASFREKVSGTQAFNALSRSSLLLARHPEDDERRVLVRGKGNYSRRPPAMEFSIASKTLDLNGYRIETSAIDGIIESDLSVEEVLGVGRALTKADTGRRLLADELSDGEWHKASEIVATLAEAGIGDREARRLANDMGVEHKKSEGFQPHALWRLARGGTPVYLSSRSSQSESDARSASAATPVDRQVRAALDDDLERQRQLVEGEAV